MNIDRYLTQTCLWEQRIDNNTDSSNEYIPNNSEYIPLGSYEEAIEIKCFSYGSKGISINSNEISQQYNKSILIIDNRVKQGDRLNNQIVSSIIEFPNLSGEILFRECLIER